MAQLALTLIGGYFGGPWGAMAASYLGGVLFRETIKTEGPRLNDLKVTSSAYGAPIPKVYGADRISGNITWSAGLVETVHTEEVGGKGPPAQTHTTYTYSCSFAVGLCEGPIIGIGKIWANGDLIYNNTSLSSDDEVAVSQDLPIEIYIGTETQLIDPTIEADKGVGKVSAHRGQAYVVFEDLQLADYGNRIPNLTFEVVQLGSYSPAVTGSFRSGERPAELPEPPYYIPSDPLGGLVPHSASYTHITGGKFFYAFPQPEYTNKYIEYEFEISTGDFTYTIYDLGTSGEGADKPSGFDNGFLVLGNGSNGLKKLYQKESKQYNYKGILVVDTLYPGWVAWWDYGLGSCLGFNNVVWMDGYLYYGIIKSNYVGGTILGWDVSSLPVLAGDIDADVTTPYGEPVGTSSPGTQRYTMYVPNNATDTLWVYSWQHSISNRIIRYNKNLVLQEYIDLTGTPLEFSISIRAFAIENDLLWVATHSAAGGNNITVKIYSFPEIELQTTFTAKDGINDHEEGFSQIFVLDSRTAIIKVADFIGIYQLPLTPALANVADIIEDICIESNILVADIETSSIPNTTKGYVRTNPMAGRRAIEPLLNAYDIKAIESDYKLKFEPMGGVVDETITDIDLATHEEDSNLGDKVTAVRLQDVDLPMRITVTFASDDRDYAQGLQFAKRVVTS